MAYRPPPHQGGQGGGQQPAFQQGLMQAQAQQQAQFAQAQAYAAQQQQAAMAPPANPTPPPAPVPLPTDYVYFERSPAGFKKDTLEKAQAAKLKLEHFYQKAVQEAIERNGR